ncbi:ACP S-malonyltransferase [Bartonella sp. DGB1]|uniref:ACP S-malonyltransferase n=1 Tax=Bartonella sp. DGB1 TaxID=3239807 RepID=UPI003526BCD4
MLKAFTFPGQGSQFVTMGKDLYENFTVAKEVFQEVDNALDFSLSDIIFNGPEEQLKLTVNTQPALMAVSIAVVRILETEGFILKDNVKWLAGHSLGEYSALCAAGVFSLHDTAQLLKNRGKFMQEAVAVGVGAMAAIIGLSAEVVEDLCFQVKNIGKCQIANDNGGGQLVVSGEKLAVEQLMILSKEKGAKRAIALPVSAPFHSELMQPAAEKMQEELSKVKKNNASIPVISNVLVEPVTNAEEIIQLLVKQVTGQVRWRETIEWFEKNNVTQIAEVGAGKILTGLAKRISSDVNLINIGTIEEIKDFLNKLN